MKYRIFLSSSASVICRRRDACSSGVWLNVTQCLVSSLIFQALAETDPAVNVSGLLLASWTEDLLAVSPDSVLAHESGWGLPLILSSSFHLVGVCHSCRSLQDPMPVNGRISRVVGIFFGHDMIPVPGRLPDRGCIWNDD